MKHIPKALSSILLAASFAIGSVQAAEMTSVNANAAYTNDLSITGYESFYLTSDEYTDIEYRFSGEGIAAVYLRTSSNLSAYTKNVRWVEYPGSCQAFYSVKSLDGNDGTMQFSLLDDDYQEAMTFTTNIMVKKEPAKITFNDIYFPASINEGEHCHLSGTITSTENIDDIEASVFQYGNPNCVLYSYVSPSSSSYALSDSDLDNDIDFSRLSAGSYYISYHVTSGTKEDYYTIDFNVNSITPAEPTVSFSNMYFPSSIDEGNGQHISGTINSTENIDAVQAVVYNSDSNVVLSAKRYPNSKSYSLYDSDLDWALSFSQLLPGDYTLTYFVASGSADRSYTHNFTVKAEEPAVPVVSFENMSFPSSFEQGTDPVMNGNIRSTQNVDYLSIEVRNSNGNIVLYSYNNLAWRYITLQGSEMNSDIDFSKLDAGDYTINYYASSYALSGLGSNTYTQYFTVYPAYKPDPVITFSGMSFPESIPQGNGQHISGTISSTDEIDTIQAVVTDTSGKVWLNAKRYPGQNSYSLFNSSLDWDLSFSELPAGNYKLTFFVASGATDRSYVHSFAIKAKEHSAPKITFSGMYFPENIDVGKGQHIKGTVSSSASISKLQAVVKDSNGKSVKYKSNLSYKDIAPGDLVVMPGYDSNGNKINDGHIMIVSKVSGRDIYCYGHSNNRNGKTYSISDSYVQGVVKTSALFG